MYIRIQKQKLKINKLKYEMTYQMKNQIDTISKEQGQFMHKEGISFYPKHRELMYIEMQNK